MYYLVNAITTAAMVTKRKTNYKLLAASLSSTHTLKQSHGFVLSSLH